MFHILGGVWPFYCALDVKNYSWIPDDSPFRTLEMVDATGGSVSKYRPEAMLAVKGAGTDHYRLNRCLNKAFPRIWQKLYLSRALLFRAARQEERFNVWRRRRRKFIIITRKGRWCEVVEVMEESNEEEKINVKLQKLGKEQRKGGKKREKGS